jgi:large subunit ribosomal protein L24
MNKIRKGDQVIISTGKDKGKTGTVTQIIDGKRVLVEGVNIVKKHQRPKQQNDKGGILEVEAPIHASNVAILDPKTNQPTRVYVKVVDGKKVRFSRKSDSQLDK